MDRHLIQKLFEKYLDRFFIDDSTFGEMWVDVQAVVEELRQIGLKDRDRVILQLWNTRDFVINYFAILHIGGVVVTVSPALTHHEVQNIQVHSGAKFVIDKEGLKKLGVVIEKPSIPGDLAVVIYTSGTTGSPKGVMLTFSNIQAQVNSAIKAMDITVSDSFLGVLSLCHVFGQMDILWLSLFGGNRVYLVEKFEPSRVLETLSRRQPSILIAVPTMYASLVNTIKQTGHRNFTGLRLCHSGATALGDSLWRELERMFHVSIQQGYGLTETSSMAFSNPLEDIRIGSVGLPIEGVEMCLLGEQGYIQVAGEVGEVLIRGDVITKGYLYEDYLTRESIDSQGWLHTGDLGYCDEDGYLYLVDRKKDLIIRGGYKIYPREVEEVLQSHPSIEQAAVVAVEGSSRVYAFLVLESTANTEQVDEEVRCLVGEKLAKFKRPNIYKFVNSLPQTPSGKILKRSLLEVL